MTSFCHESPADPGPFPFPKMIFFLKDITCNRCQQKTGCCLQGLIPAPSAITSKAQDLLLAGVAPGPVVHCWENVRRHSRAIKSPTPNYHVTPQVHSRAHTLPANESRVPESFYSLIFTAALLIRVRTWTQPKCPSTNEWMTKCGLSIQ